MTDPPAKKSRHSRGPDSSSPKCGSVDRQPLLIDETVSFVRMQGLDRTPIGGKKYGMPLWEMQVWIGPETGAATEPAVLREGLLAWTGTLEPGHCVALNYGGAVASVGNGNIVNTPTLTSAYHSDFAVQKTNKHVLATSAPTVEPTGDATSGPSGPGSSSGGQVEQGQPRPDGGSAAAQDDALAATGSTVPGLLPTAAVLLLALGVVLRRRRATHA